MATKAEKPTTRETSAIIETPRGDRALLATLHKDQLIMRPKGTHMGGESERKLSLNKAYEIAAEVGAEIPMRRSGATVRTNKGEVVLLYAVQGATLLLRPDGSNVTESVALDAAYSLGVKQRVLPRR